MSLRDVTIAQDGKRRLANVNDVMHRKRTEDFGRFWKSQWVEMRPASEEDGWFSLARGDLCGRCHSCWGDRWKIQNRKIVSLSLCRRTLKLKSNKKVRTWIKKSLRVFRISKSYVLSLSTFNVRFTIAISGYGIFSVLVTFYYNPFGSLFLWQQRIVHIKNNNKGLTT